MKNSTIIIFLLLIVAGISQISAQDDSEYPTVKVKRSELITDFKSTIKEVIDLGDDRFLGLGGQFTSKRNRVFLSSAGLSFMLGGKDAGFVIFDKNMKVLETKLIDLKPLCNKCDVSEAFVWNNELYLAVVDVKTELYQLHLVDKSSLELSPAKFSFTYKEKTRSYALVSNDCNCLAILNYPKYIRTGQDDYEFSIEIFDESFNSISKQSAAFNDIVKDVSVSDFYIHDDKSAYVSFRIKTDGLNFVTPPEGKKLRKDMYFYHSYQLNSSGNEIKKFDLNLPKGMMALKHKFIRASESQIFVGGLISDKEGIGFSKGLITKADNHDELWARGSFNLVFNVENSSMEQSAQNLFDEDLFKEKLTGSERDKAKRKNEPTYTINPGLSKDLYLTDMKYENAQPSMLFEEASIFIRVTTNSKGARRTKAFKRMGDAFVDLLDKNGERQKLLKVSKNHLGSEFNDYAFSSYFVLGDYIHMPLMDENKLKMASVNIDTGMSRKRSVTRKNDKRSSSFPEYCFQISENTFVTSSVFKEGTQLVKFTVEDPE